MSSLIIGYGNDLRSDDGAGRAVAERIARLDLPNVGVRSVSQLTPELALEIAGVETVVFVDASVEVTSTTASPVVANGDTASAMSHYTDPAALLAMSGAVGAEPHKAYTVSIPVADLGLGLELSPLTELGVSEAVDIVTHLIGE